MHRWRRRSAVIVGITAAVGGGYLAQTAVGDQPEAQAPQVGRAALDCLQDGPVLNLIAEVARKKTDVLPDTPIAALAASLGRMRSPVRIDQFRIEHQHSDVVDYVHRVDGRAQMVASARRVGDGWAVTTLSACPNATANGGAAR